MICKCEDIQIHYTEYGEGEALIMLHGNGEDGKIFRKQLVPFSKKYHIYLPDTRGQGKSQWGTKPFCLETFVEDLKNFMDALGIKKAHLLGFSDGGNIALMFTLKYPDMVNKLILNGANLNPNGLKAGTKLMMSIQRGMAKTSEKKADKVKLLSLMLDEPNISLDELEKIDKPTLVIVGEKDVIKESHSQEIAEHIKGAVFEVVPMAKHHIITGQPEVFNGFVLSFLEDK